MEWTILLFALIPTLCWGLSDFLAALSVRKNSPLALFFWTQLIGVAAALLILFTFGDIVPIAPIHALLLALCGICMLGGFLCYYTGLQKGSVGIVTVLSGAAPLVTALLAVLFLGEKLTSLQFFGIALTILGVTLCAAKFSGQTFSLLHLGSGALFGLATMALWGLNYAFLDRVITDLGWLQGGTLSRATAVLMLGTALLFLPRSREKVFSPLAGLYAILIIAALEMAGFLAYGKSASLGQTSLVFPIASTYPVVTVLLAFFFLKERLHAMQYAGIATVLLGVVLISL